MLQMGVKRLILFLAVVSAAAQAPLIGDINFYGLRKVTPEKILGVLDVKSGSPLPLSKGAMEDRIETIPGVVEARVEAACCEGGTVALFIGIEEKGAPHFEYHSEPTGTAALPQDLMDTYHDFLSAVGKAAQGGHAGEDLSAGHSLMADPTARALQEKMQDFAAGQLDLLRDELRHGPEPEERAAAATVIGYAPDKKAVINDLQYALRDPDDAVRANALRSLKAIAVLAQKQPALGINIQPTWFVEMLHSLVLSDRVQATDALVVLTNNDNQEALDLMRERALDALVEMARWKTLRYALPPFLLVGRIAGLKDAEIQQSWERGDRESVIRKALAPASKKRG